ncbi:MAG: YtxH domain-containing protein [Elusimicrobia bacterium]|nr:YtxH domain-containing protein [Elusimicrobiota bacterium]
MQNSPRRIPWGTVGLTLTAVAVGVGIGVLYAPKKGEETRKDVKNWLKQKREKTKELYAKSKETLAAKRDLITTAFKARRNGAEHKELVEA